MASLLELPDIFRDYLASCPFTADEYKAILDMPEERYVRIRDSSLDPTVIAENLSCSIEEVLEVQWLKEFAEQHSKLRLFRVPETANIRKSALYERGAVFGMDASSLAAVWALEPKPGDHVLEICCAPGTKLCCIADICSVTGVDCSHQRLTIARSQVKRCQVHESVKGLWFADGQTWNGDGEEILSEGLTRGDRKQARRKRQKTAAGSTPGLFDRVIVDAECAHDGSLKHVRKFFDNRGRVSNLQALEEHMPWLSAQKRRDLAQLQCNLLRRGFQLLKENGVLVYSTCSFSEAQNEEVVRRFMELEPHAAADELPWEMPSKQETDERGSSVDAGRQSMHVENAAGNYRPTDTVAGHAGGSEALTNTLSHHARCMIQSRTVPCIPAFKLSGACRFDPRSSATGAMFIARLRKSSGLPSQEGEKDLPGR